MSDIDLKKYQKVLGPGTQYRALNGSELSDLQESVPPIMHGLLSDSGLCSYQKQKIWFCDPRDYTLVAERFTNIIPNGRVLARTAYGELFIWDGEAYWFVMVHEGTIMWLIGDDNWFFSYVIAQEEFTPGSMRNALKQAGELEWNEIYTYVPALALGGDRRDSKIERVKLNEGVAILAELQEFVRR